MINKQQDCLQKVFICFTFVITERYLVKAMPILKYNFDIFSYLLKLQSVYFELLLTSIRQVQGIINQVIFVNKNQGTIMNQSYKILQKIGQGEHGAIFLVQMNNQKCQQQCLAAMKQVNFSGYINKSQFDILPKLNHPNIIKVLSSSKTETGYTLFQEFAPNGDLHNFARKQYKDSLIPEKILMKWLCQISLALYYLHNQVRMLHRDVKTKNILVMENGFLKLADFGTSRQLLKHQDFAMTAVGTPYYLSPQAVGHSKYNNKSDVWGLGCIMFELCTGKKPFQGKSLNDLIRQIMSAQLEQISCDYTEEFQNLVKSMLDKNMQRRITIQGILERNQIRQTFQQLKLEYQEQYKEFSYPIAPVMELKTKKYCEREQSFKMGFTNQSMKTVKNQQKQKSLKLQIIQVWGKQQKKNKNTIYNLLKRQDKCYEVKKIQRTKYLDKSLKSIIQKKKKNSIKQ